MRYGNGTLKDRNIRKKASIGQAVVAGIKAYLYSYTVEFGSIIVKHISVWSCRIQAGSGGLSLTSKTQGGEQVKECSS